MAISTSPPARILVVDDHPIVRLGIRRVIDADPSLAVSAEADSAVDALALIDSMPFDLALVDLSLRMGTGLDLVHELHLRLPALPVLVLSIHDETLYAERAIKEGARGYIMKGAALEGLIGAIHEVLSGRTYVSPRIADVLARQQDARSGPQASSGIFSLTTRELEVFHMIGAGVSTAAIAQHLGVSIKTVETYRSNIKNKLNLRHATDLIRYAATWATRS